MRPLFIAACLAFAAVPAGAEPSLPKGPGFPEQTGEALYTHVCQACHMEGGRGASGAGSYPALAGDTKLQVALYPATIVVHGLRGMPPIGRMMSDAQVAAVVNYVRTHFGNAYGDAITAVDVAQIRK
jgi:mono/diheme cytochrome c family protein